MQRTDFTYPGMWKLNRPACALISIVTSSVLSMPHRAQMFSPNQPASTSDVTTLKVKSEDGGHTFVLKMCLSETIGDLRWYLDKHRWDYVSVHQTTATTPLRLETQCGCLCLFYREDGLPDYDIISMCPWRCYDDDRQTLQSCGLTSNTTLLLQKRKC